MIVTVTLVGSVPPLVGLDRVIPETEDVEFEHKDPGEIAMKLNPRDKPHPLMVIIEPDVYAIREGENVCTP